MSGQFQVGSLVRVKLNDNETRRAYVACISTAECDVILLKRYYPEELSGIELDNVSFSSVSQVFAWESPRLPSDSSSELRFMAVELFNTNDWVGAEDLFRATMSHLPPSGYSLFKRGGKLHLGEVKKDGCVYDFGIVDPSVETHFNNTVPVDILPPVVCQSIALYNVRSLPLNHATLLLNQGRCSFNRGEYHNAIDCFSYAIFVSALCSDGKSIRSKSFYWRGKSRIALYRPAGAVRDAEVALRLSDDSVRGECENLVRAGKRLHEEEKRSMRNITREIMRMCDEYLRNGGKLDVNI